MILTTILASAIVIGTIKEVNTLYHKTNEIETISKELKQIATEKAIHQKEINDKLTNND